MTLQSTLLNLQPENTGSVSMGKMGEVLEISDHGLRPGIRFMKNVIFSSGSKQVRGSQYHCILMTGL
jgi:hypothetical protein